MLGWEAWFTVGVLLLMVGALVREIARPDIVLLGSLGLLLLIGIVTPEQAFAGFSNSAVLTVGALFVAAAGVQQTDALGFLDRLVFSKTSSLKGGVVRLMLSTSILSAFLNNTPIVAMLTPRVQRWSQEAGLPASKLLIPLSYAAILGGMVTLIGTSTNIVVSGLLEQSGYPGLNMFDLSWIGIPAVLLVIVYFVVIGHRLLPDRGQAGRDFEDGLKTCLFELRVAAGSSLSGLTIEEAGLRALGDVFLAHVRRGDYVVPAQPEEVLRVRDVLTFVGDVAMLDQLLERPGLERVVSAVVDTEDRTLPLFEAVVAPTSSLVGKTLRDTNFREEYGGVVLGIQRKDEQVSGSLGRIPIKAGDLMIIEAREGFDRRWNADRSEFYLVASRRPETPKPKTQKAPIALLILLGMIILAATGLMPLVTAAFSAALGMIVTRCLPLTEARRSVDISVLIVIAAALGIGQAVEETGLAGVMAQGILDLTAGWGFMGVLAALFIVTNILTELITHKAAAVLMVPVALAAALELGGEPKAFALIVAAGAAASFMTPIGYQTNLMVMAAGGYRYTDYFKVGFPVSLMVMGVAVTMVYWIWL